jgi:hypothetical protein
MVPSLRRPTAPSLNERQSSLRRAVPAARESISSSDNPFMVMFFSETSHKSLEM